MNRRRFLSATLAGLAGGSVMGRAGLAGGREHLVPGLGEPVTIENVRHNPQGNQALFHVYFSR